MKIYSNSFSSSAFDFLSELNKANTKRWNEALAWFDEERHLDTVAGIAHLKNTASIVNELAKQHFPTS